MSTELTKLQIFEIWFKTDKDKRLDAVCAFVMESYQLQTIPNNLFKKIKTILKNLCLTFNNKWNKCNRHQERFLSKNFHWLNGAFCLSDDILKELPSTSSHQAGRPQKNFDECSDRTKRRKIRALINSTTPEEIAIASEVNLRKAGKRDSAAIIKELTTSPSDIGTQIKHARSRNKCVISVPDVEALCMIQDADLSRNQYEIVRQKINKYVTNLLPTYDKIKLKKNECYPLVKTVTETVAACDVQSLVDHTIKRLIEAQKEVFNSIEELKGEIKELSLLIKWGCDGAQQKNYKQKFTTSNESDENLFSTCMVPIQMSFDTAEGKKIIIWQNPAPSSTRYCRPIKLNFTKETTELINKEVNSIQKEIDMLCPIEVHEEHFHVFVKPVFMLTMIDGKICTALSTVTTSSQTCYICGAKPSEMNKPALILSKPVDIASMKFGLSPLHSWIRFMECLLHISYRLDIKVWQARGKDNKEKVKSRKERIQRDFRNELGLLIDMPTQQAGNTNDGNTARRFFRNAEKTSEITGLNLELIKKFHIILETLGCGFSIDSKAFEDYARETRELYLREYYWYNMPVSVHKVLYHGKDVVASCILPIGQLSEEAQEARNKDVRRYREHFTRKTSRIDTNTDLLNRLLISSDPFLASLRRVPKKNIAS